MARRGIGQIALSSGLSSKSAEKIVRTFVDDSSVATFILNPDRRLVYANRAAVTLLGYTAKELSGIDFATLIHPQDLPVARAQVEGLLSRGAVSVQAERRYVRKDGQLVWVMASIATMASLEGDAISVCVKAVSIDGQKRAEAALAESERRWNFALESAGQGAWVADIVTGSVFYSDTWRRMRGFEPGAYVDSSEAAWLARVNPDDREYIQDTVRRQNSGSSSATPSNTEKDTRPAITSGYRAEGHPMPGPKMVSRSELLEPTPTLPRRRSPKRRRGLYRIGSNWRLMPRRLGSLNATSRRGELYWDERVQEIFGKAGRLSFTSRGNRRATGAQCTHVECSGCPRPGRAKISECAELIETTRVLRRNRGRHDSVINSGSIGSGTRCWNDGDLVLRSCYG
ncbi:MAG: PAS domain S-box protein [Devosia sp.]